MAEFSLSNNTLNTTKNVENKCGRYSPIPHGCMNTRGGKENWKTNNIIG